MPVCSEKVAHAERSPSCLHSEGRRGEDGECPAQLPSYASDDSAQLGVLPSTWAVLTGSLQALEQKDW